MIILKLTPTHFAKEQVGWGNWLHVAQVVQLTPFLPRKWQLRGVFRRRKRSLQHHRWKWGSSPSYPALSWSLPLLLLQSSPSSSSSSLLQVSHCIWHFKVSSFGLPWRLTAYFGHLDYFKIILHVAFESIRKIFYPAESGRIYHQAIVSEKLCSDKR